MTVINTNVKSLVAQDALTMNNRKLQTAMERLSTGSRINSAKDDAAGLAISSRMEAQVRGLNAAIRNANDGISMIQTAEGAMEEIGSILQRMRELAVQAASGVNNDVDRSNLDAEVQQLKSEIDRIVDTSRFNDKKLLDGSLAAELQIGAKAGETMTVQVNNISSLGLGSINPTAGAAVTEASISGVEATSTVSRMSFAENGTYSFTLQLTGPSGPNSFNIVGSVVDGSAKDIVDKINAKLLAATDDAAAAVNADLKDSINVTYTGKSVTIENYAGKAIAVSAFTATNGGGEASFTSVSGGANSSNLILRTGATGTAVTEFDVSKVAVTDKNTSKAVVTVGATAATAGDTMVMTLVANGVTTVLTTAALAAQAYNDGSLVPLLTADTDYANSGYFIYKDTSDATKIVIEREDGVEFTVDANHLNSSSASVASASNIDMTVNAVDLTQNAAQTSTASAAYTKEPNQISLALSGLTNFNATSQLKVVVTANGQTEVFATGNLDATGANNTFDFVLGKLRAADTSLNYEFYKDSNDHLVVKNLNGDSFSIDVSAEVTASGAAHSAGNIKAQTPAGLDLVAATTPYNVVSASAPKTMFLDFSKADTYTFKFSNLKTAGATLTSAVTANYTGTAANLTQIAADIQAQLDALAAGDDGVFNFAVTVENNGIRIDEVNGYKFGITSFASTGDGKLLARAANGQLSAANKALVSLDDTTTNDQATTNATTPALTSTVMKLAFDGSGNGATGDTYSFKISDGVTTAVVSNVIRSGDAAGDTTMLAAINSALTVAGLDDLVTAANPTLSDFTLTHKLGRTLTISDFRSTGNTTVRTEAGAGNSGIPKFLDDNYNASSGTVVRSIDVLSSSRAQDAISIVDDAINDVSIERAKLGAIQNRLVHTVDNLSNISTNTAESRSRIMDTDYAQETAELARTQIIQQAATAMLAQANQSNMSVLSLLQ